VRARSGRDVHTRLSDRDVLALGARNAGVISDCQRDRVGAAAYVWLTVGPDPVVASKVQAWLVIFPPGSEPDPLHASPLHEDVNEATGGALPCR
jgi:hypothetical protein